MQLGVQLTLYLWLYVSKSRQIGTHESHGPRRRGRTRHPGSRVAGILRRAIIERRESRGLNILRLLGAARL